MRSIRVALTTWLLAGLGLTVVGMSLVTHRLVSGAVLDAFDDALRSKVRSLATLASFDEDGFELDLGREDAGEFTGGEDPQYLQIWVEDGPVVARSPTLAGAELPRRGGPPDEPLVYDLALPDGRPGRAVALLTRPALDDGPEPGAAPPPRILIVTARSREGLDGTLAGVATVFAAGLALTLLLIVLLMHVTVRRALAPIGALGARLDAIDVGSLSERLPEAGVPEELAAIPPTLNALLERLQRAFQRERRMTGNVAHELRTPLAELRTAAELARRWPQDEALRSSAMSTAHDVALRMGKLVDTLLRLSRMASGQTRPAEEPVALAPAVSASWRHLEDAARRRGQRFELQVAPGLSVRTDRDLLDVAVGNLLANAVQHGTPGRPVRCRAAPAPGGVRLTVDNAAAGLSREDLAHLAEPFWCGDVARSRSGGAGSGSGAGSSGAGSSSAGSSSGGGSGGGNGGQGGGGVGLGLALVDTVAAALGARLSFELQEGRLLAHLDLPARPGTCAEPAAPAPAPAPA